MQGSIVGSFVSGAYGGRGSMADNSPAITVRGDFQEVCIRTVDGVKPLLPSNGEPGTSVFSSQNMGGLLLESIKSLNGVREALCGRDSCTAGGRLMVHHMLRDEYVRHEVGVQDAGGKRKIGLYRALKAIPTHGALTLQGVPGALPALSPHVLGFLKDDGLHAHVANNNGNFVYFPAEMASEELGRDASWDMLPYVSVGHRVTFATTNQSEIPSGSYVFFLLPG